VFEYAFGEAPPSGVEVTHAYLWRNRHLGIFFEEEWRLALRGPNALQSVKNKWPTLTPLARPGYIGERPDTPWFVPKEPDHYDAWRMAYPEIDVRLDRETGDVFIAYTAF
jgi:hypothetical protein